MSRRSKRKRRHEDPHAAAWRAILQAGPPIPGQLRIFGAALSGRTSSKSPNMANSSTVMILPLNDRREDMAAERALVDQGMACINWPTTLELLEDCGFPITKPAGEVLPMPSPKLGQEQLADRQKWAPVWAIVIAESNIWMPARDYVLRLAMRDQTVWDAFDSLALLAPPSEREDRTVTFKLRRDIEDATWDLWQQHEKALRTPPRKRNATD